MLRRTSRSMVGQAALALGLALIASGSALAQAPTVLKANNTDNLELPTSWVGGVAPTLTDIAVWEATVTGANSTVLGDSLQSWLGMRIVNPGGAVTIGGAPNYVTLGASGIDMSAATQNLTINSGIDLGASQTWNVAAGRALTVSGPISNLITGSTLFKDGAGSLTLTGANTYGGPTVVNKGALNLNFAAAGAPANDILSSASTLRLVNGSTLNVTGAGVLGFAQQSLTSTQFGDGTVGFGGGLTTVNVTDSDPLNPIATLGLGALSAVTGSGTGAASVKNGGVAVRFVGPATQNAAGGAVPATGHISVTGTGGTAPVTNLATTLVVGSRLLGVPGASNAAGGGYATVGLYDFAALDVDGFIKGGSQVAGADFYSPVGTNFNHATGGAAHNFDYTSQVAGSVGGGNRYALTYRFNTPGANTVTYNGSLVHVNGILVTPNMGAQNVTMTGGASNAIFDNTRSGTDGQYQAVFWQNNTGGFYNFDLRYINGQSSTGAARPNSLVKAGAGTMVIGHADNVYTGGTIIYEGALMFSASDTATQGALGTPTETAGVGVPTVRINGGALVGNGANTTLASTRGIGLTGPATIASTNGNKLTVNGVVSDQNGNLSPLTIGLGQIAGTGAGTANTTVQFGSGIVAFSAANTYANGTTIGNGATLQAVNTTGSATGTGAVNVASTGVLGGTGSVSGIVNVASGGHIAAGVAGVGSGIGTLTLAGGATLPAGSILDFDMTTAANDKIAITSLSGLNPSAGTVVNLLQAGTNGTFNLNGTYTLFNVPTGFIPTVPTLNSNFAIGNAVAGGGYAWGVSGTDVTLTISGLGDLFSWATNGGGSWGTAGNWNPAAVPSGAGDSVTFGSALVSGPASVTLGAARTTGQLAFNNAANSYSIDAGGGSLTFNNFTSGAVLANVAGSHSINAPVTLVSDLNASVSGATDTLTISGDISGAKNLSVSGAGKLVLSGTNSYAATSVAAGSTLQVGAGGATGTLGSGALTVSGTLDVNRSNAVSLNAITGNGTVSNTGAGTTTLSAANTGAFGMTANAGTIVVGAGSNVGTGVLTTNGGTIDLNGTSPTVGGLAGTGGAINNSAAGPITLTVNQAGVSTFNGNLTDTGGNMKVIKTGGGQLTLGGTNSLAGGIDVTGGSVVLNSNGALPAGSTISNVLNGAGVILGNANVGGTILMNPTADVTGTQVDVAANSLATLSGTLTVPAIANAQTQYRFSAGNDPNTASLTVTGSINIPAIVTRLDGMGNPVTFAPLVIVERGSFIFTGTGQFLVGTDANLGRSGGSTVAFAFRDNSTFNSANVLLGGPGATTTASITLTMQDNATINTGNFNLLSSTSAVPTTVNLNGGTINLNSFQRTGGGSTSTVVFGGSQVNFLSSGVGNNGVFLPGGTTSAIVSGNGGMKINTNAFSGSIDASLTHDPLLGATADGGLTKTGTGKLTLSGTMTYSGATTVSAGTLVVNGAHSSNAEGAPIDNYSVATGARVGGIGTIGDGSDQIDISIAAGGAISPGSVDNNLATGTMNVSFGNVTLGAGSKFDATLDGINPFASDLLSLFNGTLSLNGTILNITSSSGTTLGTPYTIAMATSVTGTLGAITTGYSAAIVGGNTLVVTRTGSLADFDGNGRVDGDDFLTWQRNLGATGALATQTTGDANLDGNVNGADLAIWRTQFGTVPLSAAAVGAVPEPGVLALIAIAVPALMGAARRRRG